MPPPPPPHKLLPPPRRHPTLVNTAMTTTTMAWTMTMMTVKEVKRAAADRMAVITASQRPRRRSAKTFWRGTVKVRAPPSCLCSGPKANSPPLSRTQMPPTQKGMAQPTPNTSGRLDGGKRTTQEHHCQFDRRSRSCVDGVEPASRLPGYGAVDGSSGACTTPDIGGGGCGSCWRWSSSDDAKRSAVPCAAKASKHRVKRTMIHGIAFRQRRPRQYTRRGDCREGAGREKGKKKGAVWERWRTASVTTFGVRRVIFWFSKFCFFENTRMRFTFYSSYLDFRGG